MISPDQVDGARRIRLPLDQVDGARNITLPPDQVDGARNITLPPDQVDGARSKTLPPDQVDGAKSITLSLDQVDGARNITLLADHVCEFCRVRDRKINKAMKYCFGCEKYVCDSCVNFRQRVSSMRDHKIVDACAHVLLGRQVHIRASLADDKRDPCISGCVFMPNGKLIILDEINKTIKLLDISFSLKDALKLSFRPHDVSVINDKTILVTMPNLKQLQYVQVFPQLKLNHVIQLDKMCWGVAVSGQKIYVSCHTNSGYNDGEVRVLDKQGHLKRRLGIRGDGSYMFSGPDYITVNTSGDKIFVSDSGRSTVICMKINGRIVYEYEGADLKKPHGLYSDDDDNVMVCDYDSENIQVITSDGKKHSVLLSLQDGLTDTRCVAYRKSDDSLVVNCRCIFPLIVYYPAGFAYRTSDDSLVVNYLHCRNRHVFVYSPAEFKFR